MDTFGSITRQFDLAEVALKKGHGRVERTTHGAFVVYSRISKNELLETIRKDNRNIFALEQMKTLFLMGPTPRFFGDNKATTSWRREFVTYADACEALDRNWLIVLPEPFDCDWSSVDYPGLTPDEQVWAQIHWEAQFIDLSISSGVAVLHAHFRWQGNAGPTARFEGGKLLDSLRRVDRCCINLAPDCESVPYLEAHLGRALGLNSLGLFRLTRCSPLVQPNAQPSGLYTDGSSDPGQLDPFFQAIIELVHKKTDRCGL